MKNLEMNKQSSTNGKNDFESDVESIRIRLMRGAEEISGKIFSVVGAHRGVGVTTLCRQIAIGLAASGRSVVVIDGNASHAELHEQFGIGITPGAGEVASSGSPFASALQKIGPGLSVLPAGSWETGVMPSSSAAWSILAERAREAADLVLFDAGSPENPAMASVVGVSDGVVVIAEAGRSRWEQVSAVVDGIAELKIPVLGVVLNRRRLTIPESIYRRL
jgi:MinD-like ATPase involved in chromosome partitioning or flagellar assembly